MRRQFTLPRLRPLIGIGAGLAFILVLDSVLSPTPTKGAASPAFADCPGLCLQCPFLPYYHAPGIDPRWGNYDHAHLSCDLAECGGNCGEALMPKLPAQNAVELVSSGDLVDIRRALDAYPGTVMLTEGRDGVQVRGCGDMVIVHVTVNPLAGARLAQRSPY